MELYPIDDEGRLYLSADVDDWRPIEERNIGVVFDLDNDMDVAIPEIPDHLLYVYFPFEDAGLPHLERLHALARLGAEMARSGNHVLSHCGMGHDRSALLMRLILIYVGKTGSEAVDLIRSKRKGALYTHVFASYLQSLTEPPTSLSDIAPHVPRQP